MTKTSLSRRAFLRTSIAGGASIAAAGLHATPIGIYKPGTYSAKAAGIGDVVVTMTFDADKITDVVLDVSHETPAIGQAAAGALKEHLLKAQSAEIDAVSGASITSDAVRKAAQKCIAQAKGEIPLEVITKNEEADDGDWLGQPPEIADKDIVETFKTDILVIGCGTGGMFAVAAAAEEGAKVIGIDRFPTGTGIRDDLGAMNSRYQKKNNTKIDKFEFIRAATSYAAGHVQQDLIKVWCEDSGEAIDWYGDRLAECGVELWHESGDKVDPAYHHHFPTDTLRAGERPTTAKASLLTAIRFCLTTASSTAHGLTTAPKWSSSSAKTGASQAASQQTKMASTSAMKPPKALWLPRAAIRSTTRCSKLCSRGRFA